MHVHIQHSNTQTLFKHKIIISIQLSPFNFATFALGFGHIEYIQCAIAHYTIHIWHSSSCITSIILKVDADQ